MNKIIITLSALFLSFTAFGQKEALYYFPGKDSTLFGVRTSKGKVIIPPVYGSHLANAGEKVMEKEILLVDKAAGKDSMAYDYRFKVFDRKGNFLYCPYWFDNGPDYYVEGLRRFVENGKMGFAGYNGIKVIPAKYNYIEPFYRGYALACPDCRYTRISNDEEHCCVYAGVQHVLIDRAGNIVRNLEAKMDYGLNDSLLNALGLIQPFTEKEKSLIRVLENLPEVKQLIKENAGNICTVIAGKPKDSNGSYLIVFRVAESYSYGDLCFLIKPDGKTILHFTSYGNIEPLSEWRKQR